jgi:hypothetical protein
VIGSKRQGSAILLATAAALAAPLLLTALSRVLLLLATASLALSAATLLTALSGLLILLIVTAALSALARLALARLALVRVCHLITPYFEVGIIPYRQRCVDAHCSGYTRTAGNLGCAISAHDTEIFVCR